MALIDIVIILIVLWGAHRGWKNGLMREFVSTLGFLLGLYIAYQLYASFGDYLAPYICEQEGIAKIAGRLIAFVVIWVVTPIVLGLLATLVTKTLRGLHLGFLNSFLGLLVGVLKYIVLLSFVFGAMGALHILSKEKKEASLFYPYVSTITSAIFENIHWHGSKTCSDGEDKDSTIWIPIHHNSEKSH